MKSASTSDENMAVRRLRIQSTAALYALAKAHSPLLFSEKKVLQMMSKHMAKMINPAILKKSH